MRIRLIFCCSLLLIVPAHLSCSSGDYFPPSEVDGGWRKNTDPGFVRSVGLDPQKLEEFGQYNLSVANSNWKPYADYKGILVIKNGWIVGEWYNHPDAANFRTYLSSNGKAFAMVSFEIMVDDARSGRIDLAIDQNSPVYDQEWLPEGFPLSDPQKQAITFEQIFQHTSGLCPERSATGEALEQGRNKWTDYADWIVGHDAQWPQTGKLYFPPGQPERWSKREQWGDHTGGYSSAGFGHIGLILRNIYGMPARQFLWQRLLQPLGFSGIDFHAPPDDEIQWFSAGGLRMTPRDYARFAFFLLRSGRWNDRQIVPPQWIQHFRESVRYPNIRSNQDGFFGKYPRDMFRIAGSGLNWAFMVPSLDLIAIRTGRADNRQWNEVEQQFLQKLFAAVSDTQAPRQSLPGGLPGQLVADPARPRWLWRKDGRPFFMVGPGDPEGFLYRGSLHPDGTRDGDQMELIGKLAGTGANCVYLMAVRSHGGDGDETQNPFLDHDPAKGFNDRILDQWERWFTVMDRSGITIMFFFYDDGARLAARHQPLTSEEKDFIQVLVNRFKHHQNLIWCVAEEYEEAFTPADVLEFAEVIHQTDEFHHPIAVHKLTGTGFSEFADSGVIDQFAIQLGDADNPAVALGPHSTHELVLDAWNRAQGRYNLNLSELAYHYAPEDRELTRRRSWAAALAGAYVMVIRMDIESTSLEALEDCGHLVRFLESTDFFDMEPHDELGTSGTEYVLASPGSSYIAYSSSHGGRLGLSGLRPGKYELEWFDCSTGQTRSHSAMELPEGDHAWEVPGDFGRDVALYLELQQAPTETKP